jgi:hypothetical protein
MDRRVELYRRYREDYGDILVQMNVEDTRNGVAEYVLDQAGVETIELKWGQGAKCIGGEIKVNSLKRALELKKRGYIVTPDPEDRPTRPPSRPDPEAVRTPLPAGFHRPGGFMRRWSGSGPWGPSG